MRKMLLFIFLMTTGQWIAAQNPNIQDSITNYLDLIAEKKIEDSIAQVEFLSLVRNINPAIFSDKDFLNTLAKIKENRSKDVYDWIRYYLVGSACYLENNNDFQRTISFGLTFVNELKEAKALKQRFFFLKALRDLRVPYRNSDLIYEGIEQFSIFANEFQQRNDSAAISIAYNVLGSFYHRIGLYDKAVYFQLKSINFTDNKTYPKDETAFSYGFPPNIGLSGIINRKSVLAYYLINAGQPEKALGFAREALALTSRPDIGVYTAEPRYTILQMVRAHNALKSDSAQLYLEQLKGRYSGTLGGYLEAHYYLTKGEVELNQGRLDSAEFYLFKCLNFIQDNNLRLSNITGTLNPSFFLAQIRIKQNRIKDAISALQPELIKLQELNARKATLLEMRLIAEAYTLDNDFDNATKAYSQYIDLLNLYVAEERENRSISFEIEQRMNDNEQAVRALQIENSYNKKRQYYLLGILGLSAILVFGLFTRNRFKNKVNKELTLKNEEIQSTLHQLKSTQSQLIQSEKMASLGELTAGIAHEIQNPLNFVNNFAEINTELIDEMKQELDNGNSSEALSIAQDIKENEEKIVQHGQRADAIVKSMLQHSRTGKIEKEEIDLNQLVDEYMRLAYHGLRAKDKSFNAKLETNLDTSIGKVNLVQQDIGRVILNLINNAFYAVYDKQKQHPDFAPKVTIATQKSNRAVSINITDNGAGISEDIQRKIFQPFFTTKPTGQGTGLGLSMSYDIIKAHGGDINLQSEVGKGTTFTITLPV